MKQHDQIQDKKQELSEMNGSEIFDEQAAVPEYTETQGQDIARDQEQAKEQIADLTDEILYGISGQGNMKSVLFDDNIIYAGEYPDLSDGSEWKLQGKDCRTSFGVIDLWKIR